MGANGTIAQVAMPGWVNVSSWSLSDENGLELGSHASYASCMAVNWLTMQAVTGGGCSLLLWNIIDGALLQSVHVPSNGRGLACVSVDWAEHCFGYRAAGGGGDGTLWIVDFEQG